MGETLKKWIDGQSAEDKRFILAGLTKDAVKSHKNRRKGHEAGSSSSSSSSSSPLSMPFLG